MRKILYTLLLYLIIVSGCTDNSVESEKERRINIDSRAEMSISYPEGYIAKSFWDAQIPAWIFYIRRIDELVDIYLPVTKDYSTLPDTLKFYDFFPDTSIQIFSNKIQFEFQYGYIGAIFHNNNNRDTTGFRNTFCKILLQSKNKDKFRLLLQANYNYRFQDELIKILKTIEYN